MVKTGKWNGALGATTCYLKATGAVGAVGNVEAAGAVGAVEAVRGVGPVGAVRGVGAVGPVRAVGAVGTEEILEHQFFSL